MTIDLLHIPVYSFLLIFGQIQLKFRTFHFVYIFIFESEVKP